MPGGGDGWAPVIAPLVDKGFRVVTFDKLGQGETDLAPTHAEWTFDAVVKHARGFIDALGLEDMILVGHSRGGLLASKLALDMPE
nr:alpha/beta fold hydrolase [Mycolicibacterium fortuitum]